MRLLKSKNTKKTVHKNSFLKLCLIFLIVGNTPAMGHRASLAWDGEQLSEAITTSSPRTQQRFIPPESIRSQASALGKVEVSYDHNGRAVLKSRLCLQGGACVDMNGSVLSTRAFAGQDARHGFVLEHEVWSWAGSTEAVRVRASIRVNYQR